MVMEGSVWIKLTLQRNVIIFVNTTRNVIISVGEGYPIQEEKNNVV